MRILVVEDNRRLARALELGLGDAGWEVELAGDGDRGLARLIAGDLDAVILDLMLPGIDGFEVLRRARAAGVTTPVLVLTARDEVGDRVTGLDLGADDYLVKPFAFEELLARLRALRRRRDGVASERIYIGDLELDLAAKSVRRGGAPVSLSAREYQVLEVLARRRGRVVSRDQLREALYDPDDEPSSNVVDVYIRQLRRKLDDDGSLIRTRRGLGYVIEEAP